MDVCVPVVFVVGSRAHDAATLLFMLSALARDFAMTLYLLSPRAH
jgi:hypothetical protein